MQAEAEKTGVEPNLIDEAIRVHDLWHTHASGLLAAGHSIKAFPAGSGKRTCR